MTSLWSVFPLLFLCVSEACPIGCKCNEGNTICKIPTVRSTLQIKFLENTTVLHLSGNNVLNVPAGSLENLQNLKEINLDENKIYFLENEAFQGCKEVAKISIKNNNLHMIEDEVFASLPVLKELYLTKNQLSQLPNLHNNTGIENLCVSYNQIENISKGAFKDNIKLAELSMKRNKLTILSRDVFPSDVSNYVTLDLVGNNFRDVPSVVREMTNLESLKLCYNPIKIFAREDFQSLTQLKLLTLTDVGINGIPQYVFDLPVLESLDLNKNRISGDSLINLQLPKLTTLKINKNKINSLPADAFLGVNKLTNVDLSGNDLSIVGAETFQSLPNIKTLNLADNRLMTIPSLARNVQLENLNLNENKLGLNREIFQETTFRTLINLKNLMMSHNAMTSFNPKAKEFLNSLTSLDLSHNSLSRMPDVLMTSPMLNLKLLNVSFNNISDVIKENFRAIPKLTVLNLRGNSLTTIADRLFEDLTNLKELYICRNRLRQLDANSLSDLGYLEELTADYNKIERVDEDTFSENVRLKKISLKNNQLKTINRFAFKNLQQLEELWLLNNEISAPPNIENNVALRVLGLCNNPIGDLPDGAFNGPSGLQVALLEGIGITKLTKNALGNTENIRNLNLAGGNNLTSVPTVIKEMPMLHTLKLSGNPIQEICIKDFLNLHNLRELYMNKMKLKVFDITKLFPALPALRTLTLADNPWICGCAMQWYALGIDGARAQVETEDRDEIKCAGPPRFAGMRIDYLRLGDFSQCSPTSVADIRATSAVVSLPRIEMLSVDHDDVYNQVSYVPLDGGAEKIMRVNPQNSDVMLSGLTPNTQYVICVTTMTSPSKKGDNSEGKETCHKVKTSVSGTIDNANKHGNDDAISASSYQNLVIVYATLSGALAFVFIVGLGILFVWCRRSGIERRENFANISSVTNVSGHEMALSRGNQSNGEYGKCVRESTPRKLAGNAEHNGSSDDVNGDVIVVPKIHGGHVNEACKLGDKNSRTKL